MYCASFKHCSSHRCLVYIHTYYTQLIVNVCRSVNHHQQVKMWTRPVKGKNRGKTVTRLSQYLIHMKEQIIYKEILRYMYTELDQVEVLLYSSNSLGCPSDNQHTWLCQYS